MDRTKIRIASAGLAIGVIFGMSGNFSSVPAVQSSLYEISSVGLTVGAVLLTLVFYRKEEDLIAAGFLLLAIAEAVMSAGTAAGEVGGQPAFGAGIALYVPAFTLIALPKVFPLWARITGAAAAVPFGIAAATIFLGGQVPSTSALPGIGYGLFSLTIVGWILTLLGRSSQTVNSPALREQMS